MKASKFLSVAIVSSVMLAGIADAGSIGRSGGGSSGGGRSSVSSGSSASKSSSFSAPSKPAAAPAPAPAQSAKPGGIGGNTSGTAVGVRKSEVTGPVANNVNAGKPGNFNPSTPSTTPGYSNSGPSFGSANTPNYTPAPSPGIGAGGVFMSSLGGSLAGTMLGNALFGHGSHGSTTVINNGTPSSGGSASNGAVAQGPGGGFVDSGPGGSNFSQPKKEYTVWSFIADIIGFVIVVAILLGVAWLFYKGFQLVRNFINKERGVSNIPFNPTHQFWTIQKAFAAADVTALQTLLGPDIVDELTNGLTASTITLHNVSHEVRLANNTEFSIWYTFEDAGEAINQVWHYEKFGKEWKLNGIETV
jgi:hypothetical protein